MNKGLKKLLFLTLAFVLIAFAFTGCATTNTPPVTPPSEDNGTTPPSKPNTPTTPATSTLGDVIAGMKGADLTVAEETELAENEYGALYGKRFNINGKPMEIYEYDPTALTGDMQKMYESAKTTGKYTINGEERTVLVNGNYMITGYDKHPDMTKIEEFFKGYKTK